jgi:hypothetical protein
VLHGEARAEHFVVKSGSGVGLGRTVLRRGEDVRTAGAAGQGRRVRSWRAILPGLSTLPGKQPSKVQCTIAGKVFTAPPPDQG